MDYKRIDDITKEYPTMFKIISYRNPEYVPTDIDHSKIEETKNKKPKEDNIQRSVRRSRSVINDYVLGNEFDMFVTFTFDPAKIDRYNLEHCYLKMQGWLWRQQRTHKEKYSTEFRYIIVPEKHKDGAIHFHALFGNYKGDLKKTNVLQNNKRVYNLKSYRFGFTNMQYLDDDRQKATAYLCKYITKDMELVSNRRRYWCSKGLIKPVSFINKVFDLGLRPKMQTENLIHTDEYMEIYTVPKDLFVR